MASPCRCSGRCTRSSAPAGRCRSRVPGRDRDRCPPRARSRTWWRAGPSATRSPSASGFRILAIGTANFIERELTGLRPDLVLLPGGGGTVHDYLPRLVRTLDCPPHVLPTHWDDIDLPLERPAVDPGPYLPAFRDAVAALSPRSQFVVLDHLQTFTP